MKRNFKLSFKPEVYFVNEKKGTVVCKIDVELHLPFNEFEFPEDFGFVGNTTWTVMGKSTCSEFDVWDETIGKKIARTKAENKAYAKAANIVDKALDYINSLVDDEKEFIEKAYSCIRHNEDYLQRINKKIKVKSNVELDTFKDKEGEGADGNYDRRLHGEHYDLHSYKKVRDDGSVVEGVDIIFSDEEARHLFNNVLGWKL